MATIACTRWQRRKVDKNVVIARISFYKNGQTRKQINLTKGMHCNRYSQKTSWDIPANRFDTVFVMAMILQCLMFIKLHHRRYHTGRHHWRQVKRIIQ